MMGEITDGLKETEMGLLPTEWRVMHLNAVATFTRKPRGLDLLVGDGVILEGKVTDKYGLILKT